MVNTKTENQSFRTIMYLCTVEDLDKTSKYDKSLKHFGPKRLLTVVTDILQLDDMLLMYNTVIIRSSKDILQGLSKLDHLIKYSVF